MLYSFFSLFLLNLLKSKIIKQLRGGTAYVKELMSSPPFHKLRNSCYYLPAVLQSEQEVEISYI